MARRSGTKSRHSKRRRRRSKVTRRAPPHWTVGMSVGMAGNTLLCGLVFGMFKFTELLWVSVQEMADIRV